MGLHSHGSSVRRQTREDGTPRRQMHAVRVAGSMFQDQILKVPIIKARSSMLGDQ